MDRARGALRAELDQALLAARQSKLQHQQLASAIIEKLGFAGSLGEVERVELLLRQRCVVAARRVSATNHYALAETTATGHDGVTPKKDSSMSNTPIIKSKTITETRIDYLVEDPDHDIDDDGTEIDVDDEVPPPAPATRSRSRR